MKLTKMQWALVIFTALYLLAFGAYYVSIGDYEFLWYVLVVVLIAGIVIWTLPKSKLSMWVLWGLTLWGFLHMAGGGIQIGDGVLYAYRIIPLFDGGDEFFILKFDQFVHFFGFGVSALLIYELLRNRMSKKYLPTILFVSWAGAMGLGALNEIVEFIAVVTFPETGVGGYYNTALDLVFNSIGALVGIFVAYLREKVS